MSFFEKYDKYTDKFQNKLEKKEAKMTKEY